MLCFKNNAEVKAFQVLHPFPYILVLIACQGAQLVGRRAVGENKRFVVAIRLKQLPFQFSWGSQVEL